MEIKEILPAVVQNQVQVRHESTPLKIGDEKNFEVAIREPKISSLPIIPDEDKTTPNPLKEALRYAMLLVGMRENNMPSKEEKQVLFYYIRKHYGGHTCSEIRLAFEMAVAGQLNISDKDVKAYENFSVIYFASIMNAYRKWAGETHKMVEHREIKNLPAPEPQNYDWREMIETEYQNFLSEKEVHFKLFPADFYEQCVQDGFIAPDAFSDRLGEAKQILCSDIQKQILTAQGLSNGEKYNGVSDLEKKLVEIRSGERQTEVSLLAKQITIALMFKEAKKFTKNLYYETK